MKLITCNKTKKILCLSVLYIISSVQFSHSVVSNSLQPHALQHARLPCPSPPGLTQTHALPVGDAIQPAYPLSSPSPLPSIFPSISIFQMSQFFASGGQRIGISASASVLPMNMQDWFPLGWTVNSRPSPQKTGYILNSSTSINLTYSRVLYKPKIFPRTYKIPMRMYLAKI